MIFFIKKISYSQRFSYKVSIKVDAQKQHKVLSLKGGKTYENKNDLQLDRQDKEKLTNKKQNKQRLQQVKFLIILQLML